MIKEFIKRNTIISVFGIVSILIAISYAATYNMPDYFGIEGWYSLLTNISISYIAALIFYVLQVYKPECEGRKRAKESLVSLFADLVKFSEITIACCRKYISIDADSKLTIQWYDKERKMLYFVPVVNGTTKVEHRPAVRKTSGEIQMIGKIYRSKIDEIKNRIEFKECDSDIVHALSKMEASNFFNSSITSALMFAETFIEFPGFQHQVDEFEKVENDFKQCCEISCSYGIRDAEAIEISVSEAIYHKNALQSSSVKDFNSLVFREHVKTELKQFGLDDNTLNQILDSIMSNIDEKLG